MCDLISKDHLSLEIISRFGLPLGIGEKTIEEVCEENGVHTLTFLTIVNYKIGAGTGDIPAELISLQTLVDYLRNAHRYFFDFSVPMLRKKLIESITYSNPTERIPVLIIRFFDEYICELSEHMRQENEQVFPLIESLIRGEKTANSIERYTNQHRIVDDQHIGNKLSELKDLIIKFYPGSTNNNLLNSALHDIFTMEQDLETHCAIEDDILIPAARSLEQQHAIQPTTPKDDTTEALSDREKDVLVEVVKGHSNKEIADILCISPHTVISHRKNISRKLNIHSTAGLTIYAIVNHLVDIKTLEN